METSEVEAVIHHLYNWLEDDRDRREVRIRSDHSEPWWVGVYIDGRCISAETGGWLLDAISGALRGMVIQEYPKGKEVPDV